MVTPVELTTIPTYKLISISASYPIGTNLVETATALANRKGVTFRNQGPSSVYITSGASTTDYVTLPVGDSVVYIMSPASPTTILFYFAVPASGSATIEREEWL
jgi:hypothetical protein